MGGGARTMCSVERRTQVRGGGGQCGKEDTSGGGGTMWKGGHK